MIAVMGGGDFRRKQAAAAYGRSKQKKSTDKDGGSTSDDRVTPDSPGRGNSSSASDPSGRTDLIRHTAGAADGRSPTQAPGPTQSLPPGPVKVTAPDADGRQSAPQSAPPAGVRLSELVGSGPQRVAKLLIALGPERAAEIIGRLSAEEVERIAEAVIRTPRVTSAEAAAILELIGEHLDSQRPAGGPEVARDMLVRAFGEDRGEQLFRSAVPEETTRHFEFLADLEPHQLSLLFRDEAAGAIAVVVSHLDGPRAGAILGALDRGRQTEVVRRVAKMGRLSRDVVLRIEEAVREKIRRQGRQVTQSVDGNDTLAAILRHMAPSSGSAILDALSVVDPEISRSVRERLYTTDLLLLLRNRDLADLLREFTDAEIALFLKGKSEELRVQVLRSVSERRQSGITEEYAHLGPQKREDVDGITHDLLERLRELEEDGSILVPRDGDRYI